MREEGWIEEGREGRKIGREIGEVQSEAGRGRCRERGFWKESRERRKDRMQGGAGRKKKVKEDMEGGRESMRTGKGGGRWTANEALQRTGLPGVSWLFYFIVS